MINSVDRKGFVYLIWAIDTSLFKIGFATNPKNRFHSIQSSSPIPLKLIGAVPATFAEEQNTHQVLSRWNFKGEWFRLPAEIVWVALPLFGCNPSEMDDSDWKTYCGNQAKRCINEQKQHNSHTSATQQPALFA